MELATSRLASQSLASSSLKGSGEWRVLALSCDGFDCVNIGKGRLLFATCPSALRNCLKSSSLQMNYRLFHFQKRENVKCTAFVFSSHQGSKLSRLRRNRKLGFSDVNFKRPFEPGVFEVQAELQSETYDAADSRNKFVKFQDSAEEVHLDDDDMQNTPLLLEQFPKRWVIVILCFSAFILCNMDREPVTTIPWRLILSKPPVWALIISHFCHNWGTFILLTWMPTYYNQILKFNLTESGLFCVLPWFTMALSANIGGWIADSIRGL